MVRETAAEAPVLDAVPARRLLLFYGWYIVAGAVIAQMVSAGTQVYVAGIFFDPMTEAFGWSRTEYTFAQTAGQVTSAAAGFFVGAQIDRRGARPLMIVGVTVMAIGLFLSAEVNALWQWMLVRSVMVAMGSAMVGSLVVSVTVSKWFVERRGRAIGIAAIGTSLAGLLLPPLITPIVDTWGWQWGWRALGVIALLLIYPTALVMRRQPEDHGLHPDGKSDAEVAAGRGARAEADYANSFTRREALRTSSFYMIVVAYGLGGAGLVTVLLHVIPFLVDSGYSRTEASFFISVLSLPAAVSKPLWGLAAERVHARYLSAASFMILAAGIASMVLIARVSAPLLLLFATAVTLGAGWGGLIPLQETIWGSYFGRRYLGSVRSVAMPFALLISGSTPVLVSLYFDNVGDYYGAFFALAGTWTLAATLILLARDPGVPPRRREPAYAEAAS